jgi:hypothetical protein
VLRAQGAGVKKITLIVPPFAQAILSPSKNSQGEGDLFNAGSFHFSGKGNGAGVTG